MAPGFEKVADVSEIASGSMKAVKVGGVEVMLANVDGKFYALNNKCTHVGGPLSKGKLEGFDVTCPWHGSKFDVRTGEVVAPPARNPEPTYQVKVEGKSVMIKSG
ncbi:MAG: Rieske (2Fe-2S) protein [Nitrososphaerales archaeon]